MTEPRRRGRPVEIDTEKVVGIAMTMFLERGYEAVTVEEIARQAGHSRRTIFRHFPSKADLVWAGTEGFTTTLRAALEATDPALPPMDAIRQAYRQSIVVPEGYVEPTRALMRLLGENDELYADGLRRLHEIFELIAELYVTRAGAEPEGLRVATVGQAVVRTVHTALVWWARNDDGEPADVVDRALADLSRGFSG